MPDELNQLAQNLEELPPEFLEPAPVQHVNMTVACGDEEEDDLVIDEKNFDQYFFDVRRHEPKDGQVLARFTAVADLVEGDMKRDLIYLLREVKGGGESAQRVMRKLGGATEKDSYRVLKEMGLDLLSGMSKEEVMAKPYTYQCEFFYYADPMHVPVNDPHWSVIRIVKAKKEASEEVKNEPAELNT